MVVMMVALWHWSHENSFYDYSRIKSYDLDEGLRLAQLEQFKGMVSEMGALWDSSYDQATQVIEMKYLDEDLRPA